jgi:hypothetical protein
LFCVNQFSLDGLTKGSIKVSDDKLPFLNHQHILRKLRSEEGMKELVLAALPFLKLHLSDKYAVCGGINDREVPPEEYIGKVLRVSQERMTSLRDIYPASPYFFEDPDYSLPKFATFRKSLDPEVLGILSLNYLSH